MTIPVVATGISGLVGTRIQELLKDSIEFTDLSLATGVNITDYDQVEKGINQSGAKVLLHMAAKADVDGCEEDKILGEDGAAWAINVIGTQNVVSAARKKGMRVIYISTDFVFDGTKDFYTEEDIPNPVNWYGNTKYEGELAVAKEGIDYTILRIAYPYRSYFPERKDFVRRILSKLEGKEPVSAVTDHIFTPTFIDDLAPVLLYLIMHELPGIYHGVGSGSMSTFAATEMIASTFGINAKVDPVTRAEYFHGRAFRPSKLALKNDKIRKLGLSLHNFIEGLMLMKRQMQTS